MTCEKCKAIDKECGFRVVGYFDGIREATRVKQEMKRDYPNKQFRFRLQLIEVNKK